MVFRLGWWIFLSSWFLGQLPAGSAATPPRTAEAPAETVRVVTYNVQFLPGIASSHNERKKPFYRAERIARAVAPFDIVVLQEVFHEKHRERLLDTLRNEWGGVLNTVISPHPKGRFTSGGCLIATRFPITRSASTVFEHYSRIEDYGLRADGFAAKGVIYAQIAPSPKHPEHRIDVFATHLEARDDALRPLQYRELAEFLGDQSASSHPVLLMGDFNTYGMKEYEEDPESQYSQLMNLLNRTVPSSRFVDVWRFLNGEAFGGTTEQDSSEKGKRIDYIFLRNPPPPSPRLEPVSIRVNLHQDPEVIALSDHNAVEAEFSWSTQ